MCPVDALTDRPSTLFPALEGVARAKGSGDVIDAWDLSETLVA